MIWFCLVLWHINNRRLFNAKSTLYILNIYLVWFYGTSTLVGHLMTNPYIYIYIYIYIYDLSAHFVDNIFKEARFFFMAHS